jgi:hypothetical protein
MSIHCIGPFRAHVVHGGKDRLEAKETIWWKRQSSQTRETPQIEEKNI